MESQPRNLFFYELCRLCLENEGVCDVFETNELVEDILACTGVRVSVSDNLPRKICGKCSEVVKNWKELRLLACKNDIHLRTLFNFQNGDDDDSDGDGIIKIPTVPSQKTPSKFDTSVSCNNRTSSKQKLSMILDADEENTDILLCTPDVRQPISLRKDLFPPSTEKNKESQTPAKNKPENEEYDKLLRHKVKAENRRKNEKSNHSEVIEYICTTPPKNKSEKEEYDKLLRHKVKAENRRKNEKSNHSEVIEYICTICRKGFATQKKLYLHQRLHNKKIYCPLDACGKKFATKGDLQKHQRTHTGEKPYVCKICDKGFTQRVSLRGHMTSLHDGKELKDEDSESGT